MTTLTLTRTDESGLLRAAARGEEQATADLYRLHWPALHSACMRITRCPDDAHDAAQDAMMATLRRLKTLDVEALNLRAYLCMAGRNAALDRVNARRRTETLDDARHDVADPAACTVECVERAERARHLWVAMRELPERQRQALLRSAFHGDDLASIAADLGLTTNATSQLLHRARRGLAARLDRDASFTAVS